MSEEEDKEEAKNLVNRAKTAANDGELQKSMDLFKKAYALYPSEKIKNKMAKLQDFMKSQEESEDGEDEMVDIGKKFFLHKSIASNLYQYQKDGVLWFWKLFNRKAGGILGDDMGLGKTIQVIAFLAGMFDSEFIKTVVIFAPLAVLINWEKEFKKWAPGVRVKSYHGTKKKEREVNLMKVQRKGGVLLTTYGMVLSNADLLSVDYKGEHFIWDYIILDEGHKIRNPNKTSVNIRKIPAKFHYICTGTAIQNNLLEMWSLFDFTQQGQLLGKRKTFEIEFQKPIVRAREKDANSYSQQVGSLISERLREIIAPYFLRRTKADIFGNKSKHVATNDVNGNDSGSRQDVKLGCCTPKLEAVKHDLIIWVYLNPLQLKLYQGIVQSQRVKETVLTTRSPLVELNCLKKICDHPRLQTTLSKFLTSSESREARLDCNLDDEDIGDTEESDIVEAAHAPPVEKLIEDSGKMVFLVRIMEHLKKGSHRTLIFSQSRKMLDIIQKVLMSFEHKLLRIDGTVTNPQDREKIINKFQTDCSYNVLLMTIQIGSVGLNLTAADRLIIFDPSWNPGTDAQAVDRIYRLGQKKNVIIYRLMTCGSIEEKIYRKQIFKNAIMKQTTGSSDNPYRYFSNQQLRELFVLDDPRSSITQIQLEEMHPSRSTDESFHRHVEFLNNHECVFGLTHHDQLFTEEATNDELVGFEDQIGTQVQLATQRVTEFNDMVISPKKWKSKTPPQEQKQTNSTAMDLQTNSFLNEQADQSGSASDSRQGDAVTSSNTSTQAGTDDNAASCSVSYVDDVKEILLERSCNEQKPASTSLHDEKYKDDKDLSLQNPCIEEESNNYFVQEENNLVEKLNSTFANIKISDTERRSSVDRISILQPSDDEVGYNMSIPVGAPNLSQSHSIDFVKNNSVISLPNSSDENLYKSCIEDGEENIQMAKMDSTSADAKIVALTDLNSSCRNSVRSAHEHNSISIVMDTDDSDDDVQVQGTEDRICHVDDTDLEESCDTGKSHYSIQSDGNSEIIFDSFANVPVTPKLVHDLGRSYRTPPFSPLSIKNLKEESSRERKNTNRDASTPLDTSCVSSKLKKTLNLTNDLHLSTDFKLDLCDDKEKVENMSAGDLYKSQIGKDKCVEIDREKSVQIDEKSVQIDEKCVKVDEKYIESKSFIDLHDVACSPIQILSNASNEGEKVFSFKQINEKHGSDDCDQVDDNCVESKSSIELHDVGCSPIPVSSKEGSVEQFTDTVPIHCSTILQTLSNEPLTDTVPVYSDNHTADTIPVDTSIVNRTKKYSSRSAAPENPIELLSEESEECHFDIRRLEKIRERSLQNRKSNVSDSPLKKNNIIPEDESDSEISKIFGPCKLQSTPHASVTKKLARMSPDIQIPVTPSENGLIGTTGHDATGHEVDVAQVDLDSRVKKLNELISLLTENKNKNIDDIDGHVVMHIGNVVKDCNLNDSPES